ncbi:hypothetical protein [Sideroxydans lithotrophicus]|uniref:hypothetical protein n=1 Tax=Sideroxydans lithotrophicus TaxID=63745 RepID=UPI001231E003|nr:hypothetical protein [Sideroxydans lithotrophicus]
MARFSFSFRLRDWLADRVRGIQYPRQQYMPQSTQRPFFRYQMPLWQRIAALQLGLFTTLAGLLLSAAGLFVAYVFVKALFSIS